jgi:hypothetical protein
VHFATQLLALGHPLNAGPYEGQNPVAIDARLMMQHFSGDGPGELQQFAFTLRKKLAPQPSHLL